jgi:hypothetical protein
MSEKPIEERVKESVEILRNIRGLGIPINCSEVQELKEHLDLYVKQGVCWSGTINFLRYGRMADVNLPRRADKPITVVLRKPRIGGNS